MRGSLLFAFIIALILHALLAWVEIDIFKRPIPARNVPKALIMNLVKPKPAKKHAVAKKPPIVVKKPEKNILKRDLQKKVKPKPKLKSGINEKKRIQTKRIIPKKKSTKKIETLAYLGPLDLPAEKKEKIVSDKESTFVPDIVDIPLALPKREDKQQVVKENQLPVSSLHESISFATPYYKKNRPPPYPLLARRKNYQGTVLLEVLVRRDGTVGSIRLSKSSGHETLDRTAIKEVEKWLFHPAKRGDELVEMWVKIPIRFQLK